MPEIDITPELAEQYLADVADGLERAGYQLPSAVPYIFDPDETLGGVITLLDVMPDGDDLGLVWQETDGWHAGYPAERGGLGCLTPMRLGVAPPYVVLAMAVREIRKTGRLDGGRRRETEAPYGRERLATGHAAEWEPAPADLAELLRDLADRFRGRSEHCAHDLYQRGQVAAWEHATAEVTEILGRNRGDRG